MMTDRMYTKLEGKRGWFELNEAAQSSEVEILGSSLETPSSHIV